MDKQGTEVYGMAKIRFISHDGAEREIEATNGINLMQAAVSQGIDEIVAECGGACSCARAPSRLHGAP